ncbi:hypothetical protein [Embleya sp. NBC_00896]|uniref:hypothetical protein n=1 Tax=Embleya sp. NBC_00896 TaxID=2975961 RepID=UPI0038642F03|nr:hypothetical protein OG928_11215 [Embleya sp. NBC_00896]
MVLSTAALVVGLGTPAQAAITQNCRSNEKSFSIPGSRDVSVTVDLCVQRDGSRYRAKAYVSWGSWAGMPSNAFDNFNVTLRLERNDATQKSQGVNLTSMINHPSDYNHNVSWPTAWVTSSARGGWSADGVVDYDINNDGRGGKKWDLYGSPLIT